MKPLLLFRWLAALLAAGWFLSGGPVAAQNLPSPAGDLIIRSWSTEMGLPQNSVNAIVQDQAGYLWLATREGLVRFDGVRFTVYGLQDGLPSVEINALCEDHTGTLWIGTSDGLCRQVAGQIETVPLPLPLAMGNAVTALREDFAGRLWVGTPSGVGIYANGQFKVLPSLQEAIVRDFAQSRDGTMWIASFGGLYKCQGDEPVEVTGPTRARVIPHCLLMDQSGNLWVSIGNGVVLCRQPDQKWVTYGETNGVPFVYVTCLAQEADGTLWAGSLDDGLYRFGQGRFTPIRKDDGLSANDIRSLCPDSEGNLWVGTRTGGLNRLSRSKLIVYGAAQGLTNDFTRSVAQSADGTFWVGTIGGGLYHGQNGVFHPVPHETGDFYYAFVDSVLAASDGSLWYGSSGALLRRKNGALVDFYTNGLMGSVTVSALCDDQHGKIWVGTTSGKLIHYENGAFKEFPRRVARGTITAIAREPDGALWIGSMAGGLWHVQPRTGAVYSPTNRLLTQSIRTLCLDPDGTLWIGTTGGGLSRYRDGKMATFTSQQGLWGDSVSQIIPDDNQNLWLGGNHGISRVSKLELDAVARHTAAFIHPRVFGLGDGMPAEECSSGFCPAGLRTQSGWLCFSTVKGLVLVNPEAHSKTLPHVVLLEELVVNGQPQSRPFEPSDTADHPPTGRRVVIPHGAWEVEFHYTAINLSSPELVRFRYRLAGYDKDWFEAGNRRTAYYHHIPPGNYTFEVTSCNADGVWNGETSSLPINVQPYFWETWWFQAAVAAVILGLIAWIVRQAEQRRYSRLETQHAIEKERLRISKDIHDDIGGILTQVSQISDLGQGGTEGQPALRNHFDRIGQQARAAVQGLDEIVWATNPKNDNLSRFAEYVSRFADECFENSPIRCWQEVPTNLPGLPLRSNVRHNVFLAVKEAFNNVLKHSGASEVWLRLAMQDAHVTIEVEDNGRGMPVEAGNTGGNGLDNMRTRLEECHGRAEFSSVPQRGTRIRFIFPLSKGD